MSVREKYLLVVCIVLLLAIVFFASGNYRQSIALDFLMKVHPGMSAQEVIDAVGEPRWVLKKGEKVELPEINQPDRWEFPKFPIEHKVYIYIRSRLYQWGFVVYFDEHDQVRRVMLMRGVPCSAFVQTGQPPRRSRRSATPLVLSEPLRAGRS